MKRITVRCPVCNVQKNELITNELLELKKSIDKGIVLLKISEGIVCEHNFFLEIDKNYTIRNSYSNREIKKLTQKDMVHYVPLKAY